MAFTDEPVTRFFSAAGILGGSIVYVTTETRAGLSHNYDVDLLYHRRTRRARSVFQRLALPTPVSISNGIRSL